MINASALLMIIAAVLFGVEAWRGKSLIAAGLCCWVVALLINSRVVAG